MDEEARPRRRILLIGTAAHPSGAAIAMLRLAAGLSDREHDVHACFLYEQAPMSEGDFAYEIFHPAASPGAVEYLTMWRRASAYMRKKAPHAVITFGPLANVCGQIAAALSGVSVRVASHRVVTNTYKSSMRTMDTLLAHLGAYTHVFCVSEPVRRSCTSYPKKLKKDAVVAPNGLRGWRPSGFSKLEARRKFGFSETAFVLLFVGRLDAQKNPGFLLQVLGLIEEVHLVFAGDGQLRAALERDIQALGLSDRVTLLGAVARLDVPDLLAAADLFVQPSLFEGHSNALLEAMAAGVPAMVSDIDEQRFTITAPNGEEAGAVLSVNDPSSWAQSIVRYRDDPDLYDKACALALARSDAFSFDVMIDAYEAPLVERA